MILYAFRKHGYQCKSQISLIPYQIVIHFMHALLLTTESSSCQVDHMVALLFYSKNVSHLISSVLKHRTVDYYVLM